MARRPQADDAIHGHKQTPEQPFGTLASHVPVGISMTEPKSRFALRILVLFLVGSVNVLLLELAEEYAFINRVTEAVLGSAGWTILLILLVSFSWQAFASFSFRATVLFCAVCTATGLALGVTRDLPYLDNAPLIGHNGAMTDVFAKVIASGAACGIFYLFYLLLYSLDRAHGELETRIENRTAELGETNRRLQEKIVEKEQAEERLRVMADALPALIAFVDKERRYQFNNATYENWFGIPRDQIEGKTDKEVFGERVYNSVRAHGDTALSGRQVFFEAKIPSKDMGLRDVQVSLVPGFGGNGEVQGFYVLGTDITERKQAEDALRESEEKYRLVAETATDAIMTISQDSRILYANPATEKLFGYPVPELLGKPLTELMPNSLRSRHMASLRKFVETGQKSIPWEGLELTALHHSGREIPVEISFGAMRQENGAYLFTGIVRDITERTRSEQAVRDSEAQLKLITDSVPALISYVDTELRYRFNNAWYERWSGLLGDQIVGKTIKEVWGQAMYESIRQDVEAVLSGEERALEREIPTKGGRRRYVQCNLVPDLDQQGQVRGFYVLGTDITERKEQEMALRQSEDRSRTMAYNLKERLRFETLLSDLSSTFVHLPASEVDEQIEQGLGRIVEFLGVDRISVFEFSEDQTKLHVTHSYAVPGIPPMHSVVLNEHAPWYTSEVRRGEIIALAQLPDDLPDEATLEKRYCVKEGIRAHLTIPLRVGGSILGALVFTSFRSERTWPDELVGRLRLVAGIFANALERKRAEELLRQSEERFRKLSETTHAVPWEADARTWQFTYVGPQVVKLLGYPLNQWYEDGFWAEHIHPEDREKTIDLCLKYSRRCKDYELEYRMVCSDGSIVWLQDIVSVVSINGEPQTLRGFMIDITERKHAEQALYESEQQLRLIADSVPALIGYVDRDRRYQFNNATYERWFGVPRDQIKGKTIKEVFGGPAYESIREQVETVLSGQQVASESRIPFKAVGLRDVQVGLVPHLGWNGEVQGFYVLASDITDRRALEKEVLETSAREQRRIGHDLHDGTGQELTGLGLMCRTLVKQLGDESSPGHELAMKINEGIDRCLEQVRRLTKGLVPVAVDADGLRDALSRLVANTAQIHDGLCCTFDCGAGVRVTDSDTATHLFRIAQEAITNAIKHGRAMVKNVRVSLSSYGNIMMLTIQDDGPGFDQHVEPQGLGLKIMDYRAKLIGATLNVSSALGGGTLVKCILERSNHDGAVSSDQQTTDS